MKNRNRIKQVAERHGTALNEHMDKIIEKYKSNPDAMYEISKEPDSYDQKKFKNSLQKIFGKTTGKVSLTQYIDKIVNEEARLMEMVTDGIMKVRQIDPNTLERIVPSFSLSGSKTLPE